MQILEIQKKIKNAKPLDFSDVFSKSIELFKKVWLQGFLLQLFTIIVMLPLIIIIYVPFIIALITQTESGNIETGVYDAVFAGFSLFAICLVVVGMLVLGTISIALKAAFFRIVKRLDYNEEVKTSDFFYFINGTYLGKLFVLMLASFFISIIATLLCVLPIIYVFVPMSFFILFFAFNPDFSVGDIIKGSFTLGNKEWLLVFGLLIISYVLAELVGVLLCGIGLLFTSAFIYLPVYIVYKHVVGFEDEPTINYIVD